MKLDSRIIEGKKPLSCLDTDEAKQFIGKKGYFAGDLSTYQKLDYFQTWTLQEIQDNKSRCFKDSAMSEWWYYFLPEEWVQEKEPKPVWKPYDMESWEKQYDIGDTVEYRRKELEITKVVAYLGYERNTSGKILILLGDLWYTFEELFENYEIHDYRYNNNHRVEWRPFGYQE